MNLIQKYVGELPNPDFDPVAYFQNFRKEYEEKRAERVRLHLEEEAERRKKYNVKKTFSFGSIDDETINEKDD